MQHAYADQITEFHSGGIPSWLNAPESPHPKNWATLEISAPYNSSVSETSHFSLLRVLKPGDYAFIGVELKELISNY
jgi:hypothetical protein